MKSVPRNRFARNVVAGALASVLVAVTGLVVTPFYLRLLGGERYGLLGFFVTLQSVLALLELGLPTTINRLVAQHEQGASQEYPLWVVGSAARLFWLTGALVTLVISAAAGWLANSWLNAEAVPPHETEQALVAMALALGIRWPAVFYHAVLMGAQRIVLSSAVTILTVVATAAGGVAILFVRGQDARALFFWFAIVGAGQLVWLHLAARGHFGAVRGRGARERVALLGAFVWHSVPVALSGVLGLVLTQIDKVALSKAASLEVFGHYMLATLLASAMYSAALPVSNALYPQFSMVAASRPAADLVALYRIACHGMAAVLFPLAMFFAVAGGALVTLWTHDPRAGAAVGPLLAVLTAGAALHGVMFVTYAVSMARGLQRLVLRLNVATFCVTIPLTVLLVWRWGAMGAACSWLASHALYFGLSGIVTHREVLGRESRDWWLRDIGWPLVVSLGLGTAGAWFLRRSEASSLAVGAAGLLLAAAAAACTILGSVRLRGVAAATLRLAQRT